MSNLQKDLLKSKLPPLPNPYRTGPGGSFQLPRKRRRDFSPLSWNNYFDDCKDVPVRGNKFRIYTKGDEGAVLLLLHGGGFSALSWALFSEEITEICCCQVLALDIRGHGDTKTEDDENMAAEVLAQDVADVMSVIYGDNPPSIVLMGHSMGGAIAVHVGAMGLLKTLRGLVVIDVVEGTALDALSSMQGFLRSRPTMFRSLEHAIEWSVRSNQIKNVTSARVSMPGQLVRVSKESVENCNKSGDQCGESSGHSCNRPIPEEGDESKEEDNDSKQKTFDQQDSQGAYIYKWRIDLTKTEKYWQGWFKDMSQLFLSVPVPKLLLLAGIDRLDRDLTVGQMQGKFQMQVLGHCGHAVHEDVPHKVAEVLAGFLTRNKIADAKGEFNRTMPSC